MGLPSAEKVAVAPSHSPAACSQKLFHTESTDGVCASAGRVSTDEAARACCEDCLTSKRPARGDIFGSGPALSAQTFLQVLCRQGTFRILGVTMQVTYAADDVRHFMLISSQGARLTPDQPDCRSMVSERAQMLLGQI